MPLRRIDLLTRSSLLRYAAATAGVVLVFLLRFALLPPHEHIGYILLFPAVVLALYACGIGPGLWALGISAVGGFYFFYAPRMSWHPTSGSVVATVCYVASVLTITLIMRTLRNTSRRLATALRRAERSEARWKSFADGQADIVTQFDAHGAVLFANERARQLFGVAARRGERGTWRAAVHADDLPEVLRQLRALAPRHPLVRFDCRVIDSTGAVHWVDFVDYGVFDDSGRLLEIQCVGRDVTRRKQLEQQLSKAEAELRDLYDNAPCGYYSLDRDGHFLRVNNTMLDILGRPRRELIGTMGPRDFTTPESRRVLDAELRRLADGEVLSNRYELELSNTSGPQRQVRVYASAERDAEGRFVRTRSAMVDVTELSEARGTLEDVVREQHAMLNNDLVGIVRMSGRHALWVNRALERMFGYGPGELLGQSSRGLYPDDAAWARLGEQAYPVLRGSGTFRTQLQMLRKDGEPIWVDMSGAMLSPQRDESLWLMLDITALKARERQMQELAYHDRLTGLPNRALLLELLERELAGRARLGDELAVCFVDLDGFKPINDTHGHAAGDQVLKIVARRLLDGVRGSDVVARLGGDEFVLVLTHLAPPTDPLQTVERLLERLVEPIECTQTLTVRVSASIGVALCPADGDDAHELLHRADQAMYAAKAAGRNQVRAYTRPA